MIFNACLKFGEQRELYIICIPGHYGIKVKMRANILSKRGRSLGAVNRETLMGTITKYDDGSPHWTYHLTNAPIPNLCRESAYAKDRPHLFRIITELDAENRANAENRPMQKTDHIFLESSEADQNSFILISL